MTISKFLLRDYFHQVKRHLCRQYGSTTDERE
jgi:hypothetical protein